MVDGTVLVETSPIVYVLLVVEVVLVVDGAEEVVTLPVVDVVLMVGFVLMAPPHKCPPL